MSESGVLKGLNLEDIKRAGERMILRDGCNNFFHSIIKNEQLNADIHVLSYCWCGDLIRSAFSSGTFLQMATLKTYLVENVPFDNNFCQVKLLMVYIFIDNLVSSSSSCSSASKFHSSTACETYPVHHIYYCFRLHSFPIPHNFFLYQMFVDVYSLSCADSSL